MKIEEEEEPTLASARETVDRTRTGLALADGGAQSQADGKDLVSARTKIRANRPTIQEGEPDLVRQGEVTDPLSPEDRNRWQKLNAKVKHGLREIKKLGEALYEIREKRLYREDFPTWKNYCETILAMSRPHANRLIVGTEVLADLAPIGATKLPNAESQLRELARLATPELRRSAWEAVLSRDHTPTITAKVVREEVEKIRIQNGFASAQQDSGQDTKIEENSAKEKDTSDLKSSPPADVKPERFDADYHGPPWFEGREEKRLLLADGSECDSPLSITEESFITVAQVTAKLTAMDQNNDWTGNHCPKSHISKESVADRQRLLVALVDTINEFAGQSTNPAMKATVYHTVDELSRLTTYLKPPPSMPHEG